MKLYIKKLIAFFSLLIIISCNEDDRSLAIASPNDTTNVVLSANNENLDFSITSENLQDIANTFSWTTANFGIPVQVNYELFVDSIGGDFSQGQSLGSTTTNELSITNKQLNDAVALLDLDESLTTTLIFGVVATIAGNVTKIVSQTIEGTIAPFSTPVEILDYFLVGDATIAGWENNNNNAPLFRDPSKPQLFYYSGYFSIGSFKLLTGRGLWHPQIGSDDGFNLLASNGDGSNEPQNIATVTTAGYYSLQVNTKDNTFTFDAIDTPTTNFSTIGVIGSARTGDDTGWSAPDTDMLQQSSSETHIWYVNDLTLLDGVLKFRANDAWDIDWGSTTSISGQAINNSGEQGNIPVTSGTYDIWFNDIDGRYIFITK